MATLSTALVAALFCLVCVSGDHHTHSQSVFARLAGDLLKSNPLEYIPLVATKDSYEPLEVKFDFHLLNVANVDKTRKEVELESWVFIQWKTFSSWKPEDYSGVKRIIVPEKYIWIPDVTAYESVTPLPNLGHEGVILTSDGVATYTPKTRFTILCDFDANQLASNVSCHVNFGFWNNDNSVTKISLDGDLSQDPEMKHYFSGSKYEIIAHGTEMKTTKFPCCPKGEFTSIQFNMSLKEKNPSPVMNGYILGQFGMN